MKRIYVKPFTETNLVDSFHLLVLSNGRGPNGDDGGLPRFGEMDVELSERGDYTRTQLWEDPDDSNNSNVWR